MENRGRTQRLLSDSTRRQSHPGKSHRSHDSVTTRVSSTSRFTASTIPQRSAPTFAKRDNIWDDDYVGILFDTFNDQRRAYEFDFNPLGVQADGIWTEGQGEDFSLDLVMESKGMVTSDGYTIEVAIPFKSLRYVAGKDKLWGMHFWRRTKRLNNSLDMWIPMDRDKNSWLAQAGHLTGLEGISTERTLELIPSLTVSETGKRKLRSRSTALAGTPDPGRFVNEPVRFRSRLDRQVHAHADSHARLHAQS